MAKQKQSEPEAAAPQEKPTQKMIFIIELSEATKKFLTDLMSKNTESEPEPEPEPAPKPVKEKAPKPVKEKVVEEKAEQPLSVSMTQIRELISFKVSEQKTQKIKALLGEFDAVNAAALQKEDYDKFYKKLQAL